MQLIDSLMMTSIIAHNLDANEWRSDDITPTEESDVTFNALNLKPNVLSGLSSAGFIRPSPIQLQAIPLAVCGLDLIVQSKSGTGKTCVFIVTALEMVRIDTNATQVLCVCPTREIAVQITEVVAAIATHVPQLRCFAAIGGTKLKQHSLVSNSHIVVGTPGRLNQLIELSVLKTNSIRLLVLDEADKLMDENFKKQIDDIFETLPQNKQMIAVSATMSDHLSQFLSRYMRNSAFVRLNAGNPALIGISQYYRVTPYHHLNHVNFDNKIEPLIEILQNISFSQCLVFSNYQTRARMLCDKLSANNWPSVYISAEKNQNERLEALSKLRKYKCRVLVSTDLTARGIDVCNINLVINMDIAWDCDTYLHRIGRAGRFGTRGIAITLASYGRELEQLHKFTKQFNLQIEPLPQPIPQNIWNVCSNDTIIANDDTNKENVDDINPWHRFEHQSSETSNNSNSLISFKDIVRDYELHKQCFQTETNACSNSNTKALNGDKTTKPLTENTSLVNVSICTSNAHKGKMLNVFPHITRHNEFECPNQNSSNEMKRDSKMEKMKSFLNSNMNKVNSSDNNGSGNGYYVNSRSANVLQNGFSVMASALFPPIRSVSTPQRYNQWMQSNRFIWYYMTNPFETCLSKLKM